MSFKYNVGMYGGSFDPLHLGHVNNIIKAASICKELYIIISWSKQRDFISKEIRYRWILNSFKHLSNVKVILIEDKAVSKEEYNNFDYWEKGAKEIKNAVGKPIDIVFCGSDYLGTNRFESLYAPESKIFYFDRNEIHISSTQLRMNPVKYWDYIPSISKPYFVKKILIIGSESTGKSTLVENLALSYNTNFVKEVGRATCEFAGGEDYMNADDLVENFLRQKINVQEALKYSNRIIFVDTDALTTKFYSKFLLDENSEDLKNCFKLADSISYFNNWDLVLFLEPDVDFVQDGTRNEKIKNERDKYSEELKSFFKEKNMDFISLNGNYLEKFNQSRNIIFEKFNI